MKKKCGKITLPEGTTQVESQSALDSTLLVFWYYQIPSTNFHFVKVNRFLRPLIFNHQNILKNSTVIYVVSVGTDGRTDGRTDKSCQKLQQRRRKTVWRLWQLFQFFFPIFGWCTTSHAWKASSTTGTSTRVVPVLASV